MLRIILMLLIFFIPIFAKNIKVGISDNKPLNFKENGKYQGLYIDIINYISKKYNLEIEYIYGNWNEILNKLKGGDVDIVLSMAQIKEREENFYFNKEEIFLNWGQIFTMDDNYKSIFDLKDKNIAVFKNDIYYTGKDGIKSLLTKFNIKANLVEFNSSENILKALSNNDVDVGVLSRLDSINFSNKYNFISTGLIFNPISLKFASNIHNIKAKELLDLVDKELIELKKNKNSYYYQSFTKWIKINDWMEFKWIKTILYILVTIILILISVNFLLKKEIKNRKIGEILLKHKSEKLEFVNLELENRVKAEVENRIKQDNMLIQQSKMAAIGEMIGAIGHQWIQPLNVISLVTQLIESMMEEDKLDRDEIIKNIDTIYTQIDFMSQTIDDFKNFFKPQKVKQNFSIEVEIRSVLKLIGFSFVKNSIKINIDKKSKDIVNGYPNEFKQVVLNILHNAKDAILDKREKNKIIQKSDKIDIIIFTQNENILVEFQDYAGGIKNEFLNKIFDAYMSTKGEKGNGIGLYMSKLIMENMNGEIEALNRDGGACFRIKF